MTLADDLGEKNNLVSSNAEKVAVLRSRMFSADEEISQTLAPFGKSKRKRTPSSSQRETTKIAVSAFKFGSSPDSIC